MYSLSLANLRCTMVKVTWNSWGMIEFNPRPWHTYVDPKIESSTFRFWIMHRLCIQNGSFTMEIPMIMDDLGALLF